MADKATIVEEQIALLESRGMKIEDKDKAKENLLDIGYYRLGFYWFPFEKTIGQRGISIYHKPQSSLSVLRMPCFLHSLH